MSHGNTSAHPTYPLPSHLIHRSIHTLLSGSPVFHISEVPTSDLIEPKPTKMLGGGGEMGGMKIILANMLIMFTLWDPYGCPICKEVSHTSLKQALSCEIMITWEMYLNTWTLSMCQQELEMNNMRYNATSTNSFNKFPMWVSSFHRHDKNCQKL